MSLDKQFQAELNRLKAAIAYSRDLNTVSDHLPEPKGKSFNFKDGRSWEVAPNNSGKHEVILPNGEKHRLSLDSADNPRFYAQD